MKPKTPKIAKPKQPQPDVWDQLMVMERKMRLSEIKAPRMPDGMRIETSCLIVDLEGAMWWIDCTHRAFQRAA